MVGSQDRKRGGEKNVSESKKVFDRSGNLDEEAEKKLCIPGCVVCVCVRVCVYACGCAVFL